MGGGGLNISRELKHWGEPAAEDQDKSSHMISKQGAGSITMGISL